MQKQRLFLVVLMGAFLIAAFANSAYAECDYKTPILNNDWEGLVEVVKSQNYDSLGTIEIYLKQIVELCLAEYKCYSSPRLDYGANGVFRDWLSSLTNEGRHNNITLCMLAITHTFDDQYEKAHDIIDRVIARDSSFYPAYVVKSFLQTYNLDQVDEAYETIEIALLRFPENAYIHMCQFLIYDYADKYEDSHQAIKMAYEIDPDNPCIIASMGYSYLHEGQASYKGIELLREARERATDCYMAYDFLARSYIVSKNYKYALDQYRDYLKIMPDDEIAWCALADVQLEIGNYKRAIELYNKALELYPFYDEALYSLGKVFYNREDYESALKCIDSAIDLEDHADYQILRGEINYERDELERALDDFNAALEMDSSLAYAVLFKAYIYEMQLKYNKAVLELKTYLNKPHIVDSAYIWDIRDRIQYLEDTVY